MNHSLNELDTCMFLYLAQNQDQPISMYSMWNQLTSNKGYHCEELTIQHKQKFITQFNCLPSTYNNIIKFYKNGVPYLVSTKLESWQFDQDKYVPIETTDKFCTVDDLVESYITEEINEIEPDFIKWLIQNNKEEQVRKILDSYSFDKAEYETYLKEAKEKASIIALLLKHKYKNKVLDLRTKNNTIKERNTYLERENVRITKKSELFNREAGWYKFLFQASIPTYLLLTYTFSSLIC